MSKKILIILFAVMSSVIILASCSRQQDDIVNVATSLKIDPSFSGTRTMTMTFPKSTTGSNQESSIDKIVQKYCPESLEYAKNMTDGQIVYTFTLSFTSAHDYSRKVENLTGTPVKVAFSNPNNVLTKGWKLEEDFSSEQLFKWVQEGARAEQTDTLTLHSDDNNTVSFDSETISTGAVISVNHLSGYPIQKIRIDTVNQKTVFDRTVTFTISQTTFDELNDKLTDYFKEITAESAKKDWLLENGTYLYTVKFEDLSLQELEGYTNRLLSSVYCDVSYSDKSVESTPLAEQNTFIETLDFSNYISNSNANVPIEYIYSADGSEELSECQIYENGEWIPNTNLMDINKYGKLVAVKSTDSLVRLRINDGKQYNCSSIDIQCTPLDANHIRKSATFRYDIATGGNESLHYTLSYFHHLNISAEQSVEGGYNLCTVTFEGTPEEVTHSFADIFGSENQMQFSQYVPFMTLRTTKQFHDHLDLSSLIVGKNIDTAVRYSVTVQNGDIIKTFSAKYDTDSNPSAKTQNAALSPDNNKTASIPLETFYSDISFDISTPNAGDIIAMCILSVIIIGAGITVLFLLKNKKGNYIEAHAEEVSSVPAESTPNKTKQKED